MIAKLWAEQIILGNKKYSQVPAKLKDAVKTLLENSGHGDLAK